MIIEETLNNMYCRNIMLGKIDVFYQVYCAHIISLRNFSSKYISRETKKLFAQGSSLLQNSSQQNNGNYPHVHQLLKKTE